MNTQDWTMVTTEELASLVEVLDRALSASLGADNKVWLKIEGTEVLFTVEEPMSEEDKRLAPARAAWRELKEVLASINDNIPEAEVIEIDGVPV